MTIELTEDQATALALFSVWLAFASIGRELDGEPAIPDDAIMLQHISHGSSAHVTWKHFRDLASIQPKP